MMIIRIVIGVSESSPESEDEVERAFLLNVVVCHCSSVFKALPGEDESLLVSGNSFFVLNLSFDAFDAVCCLCLNGDGLSGQSSYENLHSSPKSEHKMHCAFFLDVVVSYSLFVFKTLSCKDESLLVDGDALLGENAFLEGSQVVSVLNFDGNGLSSESAHEDLHSSPKPEHKMHGAFLLNVVVAEAAFILKLFSPENESLLVGRDSFSFADELLEVGHSVGGLDLACHGLSGEGFYEDLHLF